MLNRKFVWSLVALSLFLASGLASGLASAGPRWLITPDEVARVAVSDDNFKQLVAAVEGPGPQIIVRNPRAFRRIASPVYIYVDFKPGKSRLPADMKTLNVTLIGFFDIDITDRVREYIRPSSLEIERAELPPGNHRLRMTIKDIKGNPNQRDVVVKVVKK